MAVGLDVSEVGTLARWDEMDSPAMEIAQTLEDERFPGAVVPAVRNDDSPAFYALARDASSWRRLRPLLFAFAGPTFTDFEGVPAELDETEPIEKYLAEAGLHTVAVFRPGTFENTEKAALRALAALLNAVSRAPDFIVSPSEPTSILLARLQDSLNGKDLEAAWRAYSTLKEELRLDYRNLLQVEFQIHAASGDWAKIRNDPRFESVCATRPAPATAEVLLETLYWSHFREEEEHRVPFVEDDVARLFRSLLDCVPETPSPTVKELMDLLSIERHRLEEFDLNTTARIDSRGSGTVAGERPGDDSDALSHAKSVFLALDKATDENVRFDTEVVAAFERLGEKDRSKLFLQPRFQAIWSEIQGRIGATPPPNDWIEWLKRLDDPEFDASAYAKDAAVNWRLPDNPVDPTFFEDLRRGIEEVPAGVSGERLDQSLPYFVDWVARDPQLPRSSLCPVYMALLTRIALTTRRGEKTIKSAALLLESALRCGLNTSEYRDAMETIAIIAKEALNRNTAYDIFEFVEIAADFQTVDAMALQDATTAVAAAAHRLLSRLTAGQRMAYSHIAARLGWKTESDELASVEEPVAGAFSNMSVGIYTLTESAGRNARDILASLAPGIRIELNHDHEASAVLGALVARVDLFVVAWASAKHAATNFIKSRRGPKPLIYAAGKGASSLIRAIEEYSGTFPQHEVMSNPGK